MTINFIATNARINANYIPKQIQKLILIFVLSFFSIIVIAQTNKNADKKYYDIKSVKIVYKFIDGAYSGTKTLIFDEWGRYQKIILTTILDTMKFTKSAISSSKLYVKPLILNKNEIIIKTPEKMYRIDTDNKRGVIESNFWDNTLDFSMERNTKDSVILGKACKIIETQNLRRIWYWNKVVVKIELLQKQEGIKTEEYAIEIDENYKIKEDEFEIPKNIKIINN